jgi:FkbM family methyltransferase
MLAERLARHCLFVTRALRQQARYDPPRPGPTRSAAKTPPDAIAYDVGANNGDDVEYYLRKGMKVVAIEANPALAQRICERFVNARSEGRLTVLNVAMTHEDVSETDFFISKLSDKISTSAPGPDELHNFSRIRLPACRLPALIREFGEPHYVKIDIEGVDHHVLRDLFSAGHRPRFVSAEAHSIQVLCQLVAAGYDKFKIVEGKFVHCRLYGLIFESGAGAAAPYSFPKGSSTGPFGDDIPSEWTTADAIFDYLAEYGTGWKDIHATRSPC